MLVLTRDDVGQLIHIEEVIDAGDRPRDATARRARRHAPDGGGDHEPPVAGVKVLADVPENAGRGLRTQHSTITLVDPVTGRCRALLDGIEITLHRTAAASAVAYSAARARGRADTGPDRRWRTSALAPRGAAHRARVHRVGVWSRTRATAERFAAAHCDADLGQLVCGERPGRASSQEITVFNSVGLVLQDMAAAHIVLARREEGIGADIDIHQGRNDG